MERLLEACEAVKRDVVRTAACADDLAYFTLHERRFRQTARRIVELLPQGGDVLDIGGHYLHLSAILSRLGYKVTALDVPVHSRLPFVIDRASRMGIILEVVEENQFPSGVFLDGQQDRFDAVMLCEILEHVTFNPVAFWRRIHELVREGGFVFITTPNSLKLLSVLGAFWNLISLRRIGLNVRQILRTNTFGHHWKEYSEPEIIEYFSRLSPDFRVKVRKTSYGLPTGDIRKQLGVIRTALLAVGNSTSLFADNLEAVVRVPKKTPWQTQPPSLQW